MDDNRFGRGYYNILITKIVLFTKYYFMVGNPQDKKWTDLKLIYKPGFMCAVNETLREELQHYLLTQVTLKLFL